MSLAPVGSPTVLTAGQTTYTNPFTGQTLSAPAGYGAGDTIFTYRLPFGSFTPGQTTAVQVSLPTSSLADVGNALDLTVRPGFRDTDGNPNAPLVPGVYADASAAAIPKLWELRKVYVGPEDETATGPNYVRRYRLEVDIAAGQTLQGLTVADGLGASMQIVGTTALRFNISDELIARGLSGLLVGGEIADVGGDPQNLAAAPFGPAQGTIVFWVLVKNDYSDDFPSGDSSVDQGDVLENAVPLIRGEHLDTNDLADGVPTSLGTFGTDDSAAGVTVGRGEQTKTVFAINGAAIPTRGVGDTVFSVQAGDRVTYKLTYTLPISRFEDLTFQDLPPLPVMQVGPVGPYTFDRTFDGSFGAYEIEVAPDDTFFSTFDGTPGNPLAPDLVPGGTDPTDTAATVVAVPLIAKSITGTEVTGPGNNGIQASPFLAQATIGELVEFEVVLTVPEGETTGATIVDTLDLGLAFVDVTQVTVTSGLAVSGTPTVSATPANTVISNGGRTITFNLGTLTNNTNGNNAGDETITIRYRAVVLNTNGSGGTADNQAGQLRNNSAQVSWTGNTTTVNSVQAGQQTGSAGTRSGTAQNVTIVEPTLTIPKTVSNVTRGTGFQDLVSADAGDTVQYRVVLTNGNAATDTTAFDITLSDPLPTPLNSPALFSVASTGTIRFNGVARAATAADFVISGGSLEIAPGIDIDLEPGSTITVTAEGTRSGAIGNVVTNTATLNWTSLEGSPSNTQYNAAGVERTGADGPAGLNNYVASDTADVESPPLVRKTIVATSDAGTSPATINVPGVTAVQGAIGEVVRYRLVTSVGEGLIRNFQIQDNLPAGLRFLNDGSARFGFITSIGTNLTSAGITNIGALSGGGISGSESSLATLASSALTGSFTILGGAAGGATRRTPRGTRSTPA